MASQPSNGYQRIQEKLVAEQCIILDGGISTELQRSGIQGYRLDDKRLWGTGALYQAPRAVHKVHQQYIAAGCNIVSTNTWSILRAPELEAQNMVGPNGPSHWMDIARLGLHVARQAIAEANKTGELAVAFTIGGNLGDPQKRQDTLQLLTRVFEDDPPDLILMETLSLIPEDLCFPAVEVLLDTGIPVWLSFRRCRHGVCGVYGQHWGGPEGDLFGRAAHKFEEMGVSALLINCLPVKHVSGMLPWLRDFTDLPLGVYPNLGRYLDPGWKFDETVGPEEYSQLAKTWREEGAQIVGGCCGVTPEHIAAVHEALERSKLGHKHSPTVDHQSITPLETSKTHHVPNPWTDGKGREVYPLPFPNIVVDPDVFRPTQGSFLVWKHLFWQEIGAGKHCLDVGCGCGILTVQLALNGAEHVHAIDIQQEAIGNTLANAFRNNVSNRVSGETIDLYTFRPDERYEVLVVSLYQMPVDPRGEITGHRPVDFWGRNLLDHLISLLPQLLTDDGVAYLMQISILSQMRTAELLEDAGFDTKVIDFSFFHFSSVFYENIEQIRRVERLSDAYHLEIGEDDVMVMYLLEIKRKRHE